MTQQRKKSNKIYFLERLRNASNIILDRLPGVLLTNDLMPSTLETHLFCIPRGYI